MLLKDFLLEARRRLSVIYPAEEASTIASRLCGSLFGTEPYTHIIDPAFALSDVEAALAALERLCAGEPLQYVLGYEEFCGRRFTVDSRVLIPRPETQQLCALALEEARSGMKILDLCTGSGCIAWTMALEVPDVGVTGVDLSEDALEVARGQRFDRAQERRLDSVRGGPIDPVREGRSKAVRTPNFIRADVLADDFDVPGGPFDIILSNPPYVLDGEKTAMRNNVLEWEPSMALFVPTADPLLFYKKIAKICFHKSTTFFWGGVEINEAFADDVVELFEASGFKNVRVEKDFRDRDRFVIFSK